MDELHNSTITAKTTPPQYKSDGETILESN